ncbi:MAG TPA: hypothetical protein VMM27_08070 [Casimicrobiaceae bacterium]|nr:hypothetical protein [Casimicrobiaceae bacterium]
MRRSFLRQALVVLAAGAVFLPMAVYHGDTAQAASITFPDTCSMSGPDGSGNFTLNCQTTGGPGLPGQCSIAYSPSNNVAANTSVQMTVNCNTGAPFTSYSWTGGFAAGQTGQTTTAANVTTSASGNVTVSNSVGPTIVNWSVTVGGGGGGGPVDTSACTNMGLTPRVVTVAWGSNTVVRPPSFGPNDALIVQFVTSSVTTSIAKGNISAVEFNGPYAPRAGALSDIPCDFGVGLAKSGSSSRTWFNGSNPSFSFTVSNPLKNYPTLLPNTPYYLNITNFVPAPPPLTGTQECGQSNCPMQITLTKPTGT